MSSLSRVRMRQCLLAVPVALLAYLCVVDESGFFQTWNRRRQIEALRQEIEALKKENAALQVEAALLQNDLKAIERIAREDYGMVKENETVYIVYPHPPQGAPKATR